MSRLTTCYHGKALFGDDDDQSLQQNYPLPDPGRCDVEPEILEPEVRKRKVVDQGHFLFPEAKESPRGATASASVPMQQDSIPASSHLSPGAAHPPDILPWQTGGEQYTFWKKTTPSCSPAVNRSWLPQTKVAALSGRQTALPHRYIHTSVTLSSTQTSACCNGKVSIPCLSSLIRARSIRYRMHAPL